jgi:hypothetical protein
VRTKIIVAPVGTKTIVVTCSNNGNRPLLEHVATMRTEITWFKIICYHIIGRMALDTTAAFIPFET